MIRILQRVCRVQPVQSRTHVVNLLIRDPAKTTKLSWLKPCYKRPGASLFFNFKTGTFFFFYDRCLLIEVFGLQIQNGKIKIF
jgi:hypothetical protein